MMNLTRLILLTLVITLVSCDDGDIIVTSFDFEEENLQLCDDFEYVFFKVNSDNNETLALKFTTTNPILTETGQTTISLSSSNTLTYRRLDAMVTAAYFCNPIPPTSPEVLEEFISEAGTATITTEGVFGDQDGIATQFEDPTLSVDTDLDGLPDYIDFDDDGDNVPTFLEGIQFNEDGSINVALSRDTDGDGILDYLDADDDGDGILTRNEDVDGDLNPTNDFSVEEASLPNYRTNTEAQNIEVVVNAYREHAFIVSDIEITINLTNLNFQNTNGEEVIRDVRTIFFGEYDGAASVTRLVTPDFTD